MSCTVWRLARGAFERVGAFAHPSDAKRLLRTTIQRGAAIDGDGEVIDSRGLERSELAALERAVAEWLAAPAPPPAVTEQSGAVEAEESTVGDKRIQTGGARVTPPEAGAVCIVPGCIEPPQGYRDSLDPALRPLCFRHRLAAQAERSKKRIGGAEAVAIVLARAAASSGCESSPPAPEAPLPVGFDAPVVEAQEPAQGLFDGAPEIAQDLRTPVGESEVERLARLLGESQARVAVTREESDWLLSQRDAARAEAAELRRDRDAVAAELAQVREKAEAESRGLAQHLDVRDARIAELEGQLPADAASSEPSPRPLARLAALAAVLVPVDAGDRIAWTIGSTRDGDGLWCASALGCDEAGVSGWEATGDTPDEALAALVRHVEGEARARIEALAAALGAR